MSDFDSTVYFVPASSSPCRRKRKRKRPGIVIPETQVSNDSATDGSTAADCSDTVQEGNAQSAKPKKHVRFKSPSSDSDEAPPEYIQRSQQVIRKPIPCIVDTSDSDANEIPNVEEKRNEPLSIIVDTSDSDCVKIPNAQPCKYSPEKCDADETSQGNDEQSSQENEFSSIPNEDVGIIDPTPVPPDDFSQPQRDDGGPSASTPKESTAGIYSLVRNQQSLSTL